MSDKDDGGPAFPNPACDGAQYEYRETWKELVGGMSLRDWFAGQAMRAMLNRDAAMYAHLWPAMANNAYKIADAMLEERNK